MKFRLPMQQLIPVIVTGLLLFVQISGLHRHLHLEAGAAVHGQASELHFSDAGVHADEAHLPHADTGAADAHHPHGDIEVGALGDTLLKITAELLPPIALIIVALVATPRMALRIRHPASLDAVRWPHPFALHPPSNGPPRLISQPL